MRQTKNEKDRAKRQVETTIARHGKDFYSRIAKSGSDKIPTKFDSDTGRKAANKRWEKYHAEKAKQAKETRTS